MIGGYLQRCGNLSNNVDCQNRFDRTMARHKLFQVLTANIFLRDEMEPGDVANVKNLHNVFVSQTGCGAGFSLESLHAGRVTGELGFQNLQRNRAFQRLLLREIHLGHAAPTETSNQQVIAQLSTSQVFRCQKRVGMEGRFGQWHTLGSAGLENAVAWQLTRRSVAHVGDLDSPIHLVAATLNVLCDRSTDCSTFLR